MRTVDSPKHVNPVLEKRVKQATGYTIDELKTASHPLAQPLAETCRTITKAENDITELAEAAKEHAELLARPVRTIDLPHSWLLADVAGRLSAASVERSTAWNLADALLRAWK